MPQQPSAGRRPTQLERVLLALQQRGERGIAQLDFYPPTIDGGPPVTRVASRITDLRRVHRISATIERRGNARVAVYRLIVSPSESVVPDPSKASGRPSGSFAESLALDVGGTVQHRPRSPLDPDVA